MEDILVHNTQPYYNFMFVPKDMYARFLNAINIDFDLYITNLSSTVHNELSSQYHTTLERKSMNNFCRGGGANWCP